MNHNHKDTLDDLLRRTKAAQEASERTAAQPEKRKGLWGRKSGAANGNDSLEVAPADQSTVAIIRDAAEDLRGMAKLLNNIKIAAQGFKEKALDPIWSVIGPPLKFFGRGYKWLWDRYAYNHDKDTGEKTLSKTKAGIMLAATFAAAVGATPTLPGDMVRYVTFEPAVDSVMMLASMKQHETVYLTKTQEIDPAENIHRVYGCRTQHCTASDAVTYNLTPRLSHVVWNTAVKGHPFFQTDRIAAAIPPGLSKCDVTSYGGRFSAAKYFQIFPKMLDVQCEAMGVPAAATAPSVTP